MNGSSRQPDARHGIYGVGDGTTAAIRLAHSMTRFLVALSLAVAGCSSPSSPATGDAGPGSSHDAGPDGAACIAAQCEAPANSQPACHGSTCGFTCDNGYANCDGDKANGCEAELDRSANCGSCGHDCEGAACSSGACAAETFASGLNTPEQIAADGTNVYVVEYNQIASCPRLGCGADGPTPVYPTNPTGAGIAIGSMQLDAADIWIIESPFGDSVKRCPKTGCTTLTAVVPSLVAPYDLVVDDTHLFWLEGQTFGSHPTPSRIMRANKDGSAVTVLGQGLDYTNLAVFGSTLYFIDGTVSTGGVRSCSIDDCSAPTPIMPDVFAVNVESLYVDASGLYVMQNGSAYYAALGSSGDTKLGPGSDLGSNVVAVGSTLFWGQRGDGTLDSLPESGGAPSVLVSGLSVPQAIAADATAVYLTTHDGNVIKLVP